MDTVSPDVDNELNVVKVHLQFYSFMVCTLDSVQTNKVCDEPARSELDSHATLPVLGRSAFIFADSGRTASVSPYSPEYKAKQIMIVDATLLNHDKFTAQDHILIVRNEL